MDTQMIRVNYAKKPQSIHSHFHDSYQLIYVKQGRVQVTVSGRTYEATDGSLVLIGRLESHSVRVLTEQYCRYTVGISPNIESYKGLIGENLLSLLGNRPEQFRHCMDMSGCGQVAELLRQMAGESEADALSGQLQLFRLCQLLAYCCRLYPMQVPENAQRLHTVTRIQRYLEQNLTQRISLEALSRQFHLSPSYLSHLFKAITGSSVLGYMTACRLQAAKRYLVQTRWPISRIVEESGFTDSSNFSRTFRQSTGMSPSQFRKQHQK